MGVLWESASGLGPEGWKLEGLTGNYLRVTAHSTEKQWNQISQVQFGLAYQKVLEWMSGLPLSIEMEHAIVVHGYI